MWQVLFIVYSVDMKKLEHMEVLYWPVLKSWLVFKWGFEPKWSGSMICIRGCHGKSWTIMKDEDTHKWKHLRAQGLECNLVQPSCWDSTPSLHRCLWPFLPSVSSFTSALSDHLKVNPVIWLPSNLALAHHVCRTRLPPPFGQQGLPGSVSACRSYLISPGTLYKQHS